MAMVEPVSAAPPQQGLPVAVSAARLRPFATDDAGRGYFRTDYHHRFLATALLRQLEQGRSLLLLSGEPAADGELLERFINEERERGYRASLVRCRPGMSFADVVRAYGRLLALQPEADGTGIWTLLSHLMIEARSGLTRVLILENVEALERASFDELLGFTQLDQPHVMPVVLLAASAFAEDADAPHLAFLRSAITARVPIDRLEPEEVGAFIRYQLNAFSHEENTQLPPETVGAIVAAAAGSAAIVNSLARQAMEAITRTAPQRPPLLPPATETPATPPPPVPAPVVPPAADVEPMPLLAPLREQSTRHRRRRWWLPATVTGAIYVAAVALSGLALLYLLVPDAPQSAPPVAALAALPPDAATTAAPATQPPSGVAAAPTTEAPAEGAVATLEGR
jgi:type II secretory pathway predicted ATPase ExeA